MPLSRKYLQIPKEVQRQFGTSLRAIQCDMRPFLPTTTLSSIGAGVIELKIVGKFTLPYLIFVEYELKGSR